MAVATSIILAAIAGGATVAGAEIASHGQNDAAQTQADATRQASQVTQQANDSTLAFQQKQYADTQARLAPYRAIGQGATNSLASLYGISMPPPSGPAPTQRTPNLPPTVPMPAPGQQTIVPAFGPQSTTNGTGGNLAMLYRPPSSNSGQQVTVKAPDGETRQMTNDLAQHYLSLNKGYALVNGAS